MSHGKFTLRAGQSAGETRDGVERSTKDEIVAFTDVSTKNTFINYYETDHHSQDVLALDYTYDV
ncbi:hypothetical protein [Haladaptatus sp. R4]|uniref:hypothetical protein n=1 Tax=Haladaptatus sp. R4 TaxID=1679489 RepID=UPI0012375440|nr:hypothetical protein [Haladaptatus sp. R4]